MENESDVDISISSWKEKDMDNDADKFNNNVDKFTLERIEKGACGEKYKLKLQDKCFFKKQFVDGNGDLAEQALSSAFISCFSHTPYPVGKTYDDKGRSFLVWRYDDCQKKDNDNDEYNIFFNYRYIEDEYKNDKELEEQFYKMDKKMQKYAIMLHIHQFFFNLYDRKLENLILTDEKLIHLDLDRCFFFFFTEGETFKFKDKFCNLYDNLSKNNKDLIEWKDETIRKINNIDYDVFIKRYIRNCIVFEIPFENVLQTLKNFVANMKTFYDENYILNQTSNNQWLSSLQKACKKFYESFLNNNIIKSISSNQFDEQFFQKWSIEGFRQFFKRNKNMPDERMQLVQQFVSKQINSPIRSKISNNNLNDEEINNMICEDMKKNIKQVIEENKKKQQMEDDKKKKQKKATNRINFHRQIYNQINTIIEEQDNEDEEEDIEKSINNDNEKKNNDISQKEDKKSEKKEDDLKNSQMLNENNNKSGLESNNDDNNDNRNNENELNNDIQENNINQTNINNEENNLNNNIKENNNISNINNEEKSTNSLKENNNDIQEKEQEVKPEEQSSKELEKKSNANDVNIQITNMKDATKIEEGKDTNANNILLQNKNIQIKTSNNNISESKFGIKPEIEITNPVGDEINDYKQREMNNKNSNETKLKDKNNKDPTFEDENENKPIENNQSSKYNLCKDCNCKCWPFN